MSAMNPECTNVDLSNPVYCFLPFTAPKMSSQEDEYIVEKILHHTEFDSLVRKALRSKAKFNPESIQDERRKHSKYAYLVAWEGYNLKDRTWEPEENLRDCVRLKEYKEAHNMPLEHEKFEKLYPAKTTRELGIAADDVTGIQWLMTKEEKDKRNEAKEKEKQEREAEEALRRKRKLERQKARAATQQNGSENFKKPAEVASRKSSKSNGESSSTDHENNIKEKPYPVLPGIVSLDSNTPRIQKKSKVDESNGKPTTSTSMGPPLRVVLKTQSSNEPPSSKNPPIKLKLKKMPGGHYEHARPVQPPIVKASSLSILAPQRAISQESIEAEEKRNKELVLKNAIDKATRELNKIKMKLKKFPKIVEVVRPVRSFPYALNMRKFRRCQSDGMLNEYFNRNADLETFAINEQRAAVVKDNRDPCIIRTIPELPFCDKKGAIAAIRSEEDEYNRLAKANISKMRQTMQNFRFDANFKQLLELLVTCYSKDDSIRFKNIFLKGFPKKEKFNAFRFAAIVLIMAHCTHSQWEADEKLFTMVESEGNVTWGNIRQQEVTCSLNHRKCAWLRVFFELIPKEYRFLEKTGRNLTGSTGNDGPFREAVFFQCMRSGAECQKRLFFEFNKPIGSEEEPAGDYSCDAMHFLAVQYGNLQRFASYISLGGLDVNALATNTNTNRVIRLYEYLKEWIEKNVSDSQSTNEHKKYYKKMLEMVRLTAKSFHAFVSSEMNQMISKRLQERSKILMELTYPHVLRCSPYNNESMDGDGNQVLSCLFYPEHSGYKDGLDTIAVNEKDKENLKELKAIHQRFRKIVSEERGRLILALYRVNIKFAADITRKYELPIFEHERSDEGFKISRMTLLRQIQVDDPELVDIELIEFKPLSTPGCRYFMVEKVEQEARLIVPGNAHIEIQGEFEKPMTFATQVFLMKKDAT